MGQVIQAAAKFKHKYYYHGEKLFSVRARARALAAMGALERFVKTGAWSRKDLACAAHHIKALQCMADAMDVGEEG